MLLGEIRSSIAPRKPERTASMREREAQLELVRKRQRSEAIETSSICSSIEAPLSNSEHNLKAPVQDVFATEKLEEVDNKSIQSDKKSTLKNSVRKINTTIDSYLKDKRNYENVYDITKAIPSLPIRSNESLPCSGVLHQRQVNDSLSFTTKSECGTTKYGLNNSLGEFLYIIILVLIK